MCKNFWKKHVFQFFRDIWTDLSPYPHINVEKCYFCVARNGVIKITNIDTGERGGRNGEVGAKLQEIGQEMFSKTSIVCKNFWKKHVFQFFRDIWTDLPPYPHINVEKCYFCVARNGVIKITNIDTGERGGRNGEVGAKLQEIGQEMFSKTFLHTIVV